MVNTTFDLAVVFGAQILFDGGAWRLAPHTQLRAIAAGILWQRGRVETFLICGGYNVGVRYTMTEILDPPDFSLKAFALARETAPSEAAIIAEFLRKEYGIPRDRIFMEELSSFTVESLDLVGTLLKRSTFDRVRHVALISSRAHLKRIFSALMMVLDDNHEITFYRVCAEELSGKEIIKAPPVLAEVEFGSVLS